MDVSDTHTDSESLWILFSDHLEGSNHLRGKINFFSLVPSSRNEYVFLFYSSRVQLSAKKTSFRYMQYFLRENWSEICFHFFIYFKRLFKNFSWEIFKPISRHFKGLCFYFAQ